MRPSSTWRPTSVLRPARGRVGVNTSFGEAATRDSWRAGVADTRVGWGAAGDWRVCRNAAISLSQREKSASCTGI